MENMESPSEATIVPEPEKVKKYAIWFKNKDLKTRFKEARKKEGMKSEAFLEHLLQTYEEVKVADVEFEAFKDDQLEPTE